jgi:hypothetical protein
VGTRKPDQVAAMDPRPPPQQQQHAYSRPPPERTLIHNPNHQPPQGSQPPPYANYPPASQPQSTMHMPFTADPYPPSRRDPFMPTAAHHARRSSYGVRGSGGEAPRAGPDERHGAWGNTGTIRVRYLTDCPAVV